MKFAKAAAVIGQPKQLKVLWLLADIAHGGIGTYTANLFNTIVGKAVEPTAIVFYTWSERTTDFSLIRALSRFVRIICTDERMIPDEVKAANPHIEFRPGPRIYDELLLECDIATTASNNPHVLSRTNWHGKPLLVQLHSVCKETQFIARRLMPYATHYLVTSHEAYAKAISAFGIPASKLTLVELAVDANRLASWQPPMELRQEFLRSGEHGLTDESAITAHWLLFFGRFASEKRIPKIAEAVKVLNLRGRRWVGVFIGGGRQLQEISATIRQTIPGQFILLPWIDNIGDAIHASDVFVCASKYEGGPTSSIEALLAGIPIVSTDVGILPSVKLLQPKDGQQCQEYLSLGLDPTPELIAARLEQAVGARHPTERHPIAYELAGRAAGRFSVSRMAADWIRVLRGLCGT